MMSDGMAKLYIDVDGAFVIELEDGTKIKTPAPTREQIALHLWERFIETGYFAYEARGSWPVCFFCDEPQEFKDREQTEVKEVHTNDCIYIAARALIEGE